jgi:hypothetical protein
MDSQPAQRPQSWLSAYAWLSAKLPAIPRLKPLRGFERARLLPQIFYGCDVLLGTRPVIPPVRVIALAKAKSQQN